MNDAHDRAEPFDLVIVGAGFAGLYMLQHARELGFSACVVEAGGGVGGTWYWNRYPGARCDVQSLEYSYGFDEALQQQWRWRERYASQAEILHYANHVAERFDLLRDIVFGTPVRTANYDDGSGLWQVHSDDGRNTRASWSSSSAPRPIRCRRITRRSMRRRRHASSPTTPAFARATGRCWPRSVPNSRAG
jgi:cyclohexanone monooxygenase